MLYISYPKTLELSGYISKMNSGMCTKEMHKRMQSHIFPNTVKLQKPKGLSVRKCIYNCDIFIKQNIIRLLK